MKRNNTTKILLISFIIPALYLSGIKLTAQVTDYKYFYRVYFKDKGAISPNSYSPGELLSPRAVNRREKAGIPVPQFNDLPVNQDYLNGVKSKGFFFHCSSKWMNTGLFKTQNQANINVLLSLPYVKDVKIVKTPSAKSNYSEKLDIPIELADNPRFDNPLTMLNGQYLHDSGFDGKGVMIAVLDGGFIKADIVFSLNDLRTRRGIKGTRDFVSGSNFVYSYHNHGTAVLSVLAGRSQDLIEGTAPGADYWLIRTEDVSTEFPVEEDYWAAGAEFADSVGVDIISSSLGYSTFDNTGMNYKFSDMNGRNTFVTQAANTAASKGILVVNSAGNERTKSWLRIIAPSDGYGVVAAGAVDESGTISTFSSAGPSADGRIKPDNTTQGVNVPVQTLETGVSRANGTSFSCPVLSGMCACIMQAVPKALNTDIIDALHKNASNSNKPDSLYGYGIPNMAAVIATLQEKLIPKSENATIIGPNPFTGEIEITFKSPPGSLKVIICSASGQIILNRTYQKFVSRTLRIDDLQDHQQGVYFITLMTDNGTFSHKVIKLKN